MAAINYSNASSAPPPPYPASTYSTSSSLDKEEPVPPYDSSPAQTHLIPPILNSYFQSHGLKLTRTFHLGTSSGPSGRIFAAEMHSGMTKKPLLVLRSGPTTDLPVLATVNPRHLMSDDFDVEVFLPGGSGSGGGSGAVKETVKSHMRFKKSTYTFSVDCPGNGNNEKGGDMQRREDFEWRFSRGDEVRGVSAADSGRQASRWTSGWKLVRTSSSSHPALTAAQTGGGGARGERDAGMTSDGKEVLAVWAHDSSCTSMSRAFNFQLVGNGRTGVLGERWEVVALMSALRLWYYEWTANRSAAVPAPVVVS